MVPPPPPLCARQVEDGSLFELEDIYGVVEEHQPSPGQASGAVVGAAVTPADALSVEGDECVICLANERDTTVMPCRHMCLCGVFLHVVCVLGVCVPHEDCVCVCVLYVRVCVCVRTRALACIAWPPCS